jgi:hypothetical protein
MNCTEGGEPEAGDELGGGGGGIDSVAAEVTEGTGATIACWGSDGGGSASWESGGSVGGVAARPEGTHAMVSGTADGTGVAGGAIGGRVGGPAARFIGGAGSAIIGGGAGASAAERSREPHFSQNLDAAAFCAPHSSQN